MSSTSHGTASLWPLLKAVIYGDSAYPSGRYTLSHGLEGLVQTGRVRGADEAGKVLDDHLHFTAGPGDGTATACAALLAGEATTGDVEKQRMILRDLDAELSATKITGELRKAATRVGRQTLQVHRDVKSKVPHPRPTPPLLEAFDADVSARLTDGNQAIAMGLIHTDNGLGPHEAVAVELLGLAVGWSSAALRLRQCDHVTAQAMVARSLDVIEEVTHDCVTAAEDILATGAHHMLGRASPGSDLASAAHEVAPARLFMS